VSWASASITSVLGYSPDEVVGVPVTDFIHEDDRAAVGERYAKLTGSGGVTVGVARARHADGHFVWIETTARSYRTLDGSPRTSALIRDVTELQKALASLRESEERYRRIAENASDLIAELDGAGRFLYISPNCLEILGYPVADLLGRAIYEGPVAENIHPEDRETLLTGFGVALDEPGDGRIEYRFRRSDGVWRWFETRSRVSRGREGEIRVVCISRDITERVHTQQELRRSEERYRVLFETTYDLVAELDAEGRVIFVSPSCKRVLGLAPSEMEGTTPFHLIHPDDVERLADAFTERVEANRPPGQGRIFRVRHRDGSWRWLQGGGVNYEAADGKIHIVAVSRDITERVRAEEERRKLDQWVQQGQKFESLGVMAGGIAHDFNNLLTPILGDSSLALMDLPGDSPVRTRIEKIQKAAQQAAALTHQMLDYAGMGSVEAAPVDLSQLVRDMERLLLSAVAKRATLAFDLGRGLPPVAGDATQLSQVVMNLVANAAEATDHGRGHVTVRTGASEAGRDELASMFLGDDLSEGSYAFLEVVDDGSGMDEETRSRLFDPFFTTKFTGRGLGLAAVLGIVRGHHGAIDIETAVGRGTRIRVLLPCGRVFDAARNDAEVSAPECIGVGTILVVDDDEGVRDLTAETLRRAGLSVLLARDGPEAVALFHDHADEIGLVVLDRTMPGSNGEQVIDAVRQIRPAVRVVLVSGHSPESTARSFAGRDVEGFLQKPFLPSELLAKVRELLSD
jgi:PAS domain S-box-containing protein